MPPRARPGRTAPEQSKTIAKPNTKSRQKAEGHKASTDKANEVVDVAGEEKVIFNADGVPFAKITFGASELIPTGDFANVNLGPAVVSVWVDLTADDPLPQSMREGLVQAQNQLADTVLRDILGVQRNIILEALQDEATGD